MKVGIYVRVSTTQQIDRDSLKTQEERLRQYCKAHNYEIYKNKVYKDEGISAKDTKRPAFEELMRDIEAGKIQAVIVTRLDRITRSLKDLINLMEFLQKHDVKLISLTENIDTTGPMGRFILNLLGSIAQLEREIDSERVAADMYHRALSGKWTGGVVPLGYTTKGKLIREFIEKDMKEDEALREANKIAPEKGKLYVVKEEAKLVKKIYELYLEFKSLRKVTHELNKQGIKTPYGETWAASSIRRILTNPTYIGKIWYGKRKTDLATGKLKQVKPELWKIAKGEHEAIISEEVFNRVQKLLRQRYMKPTKATQFYLLSGLLKCGLCGGSMFGYVCFKKKYGKEYFYYRCQNSLQKGKAVCKGMVVPGRILEKIVIDSVLNLSKNKKFLNDKELLLKTLKQKVKPSKVEIEEEKKKLLQEEKRLLKIRDTLLEKLENKIIDDAIFVERFNKNKQELETIRNRIAELVSRSEEINLQEAILQTNYDELCNLPQTWQYLMDEEKRDKLRTIIKQITVNYERKESKLRLKIELFLDFLNSSKKHSHLLSFCIARASLQDRIATFHGFTPVSEHAFIYTINLELNLNDFNPTYPKEPKNLAELIYKARIDKSLTRKELASLLKVSPETIANWEIHNIKPSIRYLNKIEQLLDIKIPTLMLNASSGNFNTLGGKIKEKRLDLRLTQRELAEKLEVSVDAIADWEADRHKPYKKNLEKIERWLSI